MRDLKIVFNLISRLVPLTQEKKEPGNKVELYSYQAHRQGGCTCNPPPGAKKAYLMQESKNI